MKAFVIPEYYEVSKALKGRKGLRTARTKTNGFHDYVWRMARFYSGIDAHMPVSADFWLANWADYSYANDSAEEFKVLRDKADGYAFKIIEEYNLGVAGLARWGRIFGVI